MYYIRLNKLNHCIHFVFFRIILREKHLNLEIGRYFNDHLVSHFLFGEIKAWIFQYVCSFNRLLLTTHTRYSWVLILGGCDVPKSTQELLLPSLPLIIFLHLPFQILKSGNYARYMDKWRSSREGNALGRDSL